MLLSFLLEATNLFVQFPDSFSLLLDNLDLHLEISFSLLFENLALLLEISNSILSKNLGLLLKIGIKLLPEFVALTWALSIYTSAFIAENVRGGILAIEKGQTEAAQSLGLRPGKVLSLVVLPQALRVGLLPFLRASVPLIGLVPTPTQRAFRFDRITYSKHWPMYSLKHSLVCSIWLHLYTLYRF